MTGFVKAERHPDLKPPASTVGVLGWLRANLFGGWVNSLLTVAVVAAALQVLPPLVRWAFLDAVWSGSSDLCRQAEGACWSVVTENLRFIAFGFYPHDQHWRPATAVLLLVALLAASRNRARWGRPLGIAWGVGLVAMAVLLKGGVLGLVDVETAQWSGLPLTMLLAVFGMVGAYPLGVLLALGRRSPLPVVKSLSVVYIEMIRGVPLISLLFMSSVMFPLFLPEGLTINKILRAQVAIILFTAAYIAEVVRGGLQAIPRGQYEAADSLGLHYPQKMRLVVLPQALKIVIPPSVGVLISAFKDTSLVVIIALFDILKTTQSVLSNPLWMGYSGEAYVFLSAFYFVCCYAMSSYSRRLEKELHTGR